MTLQTLDPDLLVAARAAAEQLAEAGRQYEMARADYHHAVRRLHLAGAPLRDVARALGISHQRVQQIVQAGGGTWWSRVWHGRRVRPDMTCSFCGLPPGQVAKLIAGPRVYICDACVSAAEHALRGSCTPSEPATIPIERLPSTSLKRCSFCGRRARADRVLLAKGEKRVCDRCLELCRGILDDRSPRADAARV